MNLNYTKGSIAVYVVYNQQHLINTLKHVWLQRFSLRPIAVDNILANFMGSTIMTISCLFSTIEGRCWPSYVRTASGEGHYWLHASVGSLLHEEMWFISRFLSRSLGWSQRDAHLRGWALGHWWPCFVLGGGWLEWPGGTSHPSFDADRYIALSVHILYVFICPCHQCLT